MSKQLSSFQPQLKSLLDGLVAYWKLDSNSNDTVGSNNGTDTGVTYSTGKIGNGAVYTGGTSYTQFSSYLGTVWDNPYTISMWVKANTLDTTNGNLLLWPGDRNQQHLITSTNKLGITCYNGAVASVEGSTSLTTGTWYHAIFVRTGSTTGKIYLNGVDNTNLSTMQSPTNTLAQGFRLASREDNTSANFDGMIDEVGVWNRALSDVEIKALYNSGNAMAYPLGSTPNSTKLYMPLNGNSVDISGNGNHGTDTAITYVGGKFGQGARFNGSNSDIGVPYSIQSKGTLSLWFKRNDTTTGNSSMAGYTTIGVSDYLRINPFNNNTINFTVKDESLNPTLRTDTFWHNAILTWDSTGLWYGYVDGNKIATGSASKDPATTGYLRLGITANGTGIYTSGQTYFNGIIDEVIIENRAWTPQEISLYYRKSMLNYRTKSLFNLIKDFVLTGDTAVFTITGYDATMTLIQRLVADTANFIITGYDALIKVAGAWRNPDNKSSTTYTNPDNKSSSTWTNTNKNS